MSQRRRVLRFAAVASSVLLVGGFIAYSLGRVAIMAGSKSNPAFKTVPIKTQPKPPAEPPEHPPPEQPQYMSGSKSTFIFVGTGVKPPSEEKPSAAPTTPPAGQKPSDQPNPSR
jgi:hypothetical protein